MSRRRSRRPPPDPPPERPRLWRRRKHRRGGTAPETQNDARPAAPAPTASPASEQERLISEALADMRRMDVREVMTPRVDVVALTIPVHVEDVAAAVRQSGHSAFPVVHRDLDDLVGVLFVNDLFRSRHVQSGEPLPSLTPLDISRRLRPAHVVPESLGVLDALAEMRRQRRAFAVVVDEYGGVAGVLTVKDLLEPLVGDLHDEFDAQQEAGIVRVDSERWLIDGRTSVDEVHERLAIDIPEGEYVTMGGYLFDVFGHIPGEGEHHRTDGWDLRVVEMDKRRIAKVVATHLPAADDDHGTDDSRQPSAEGAPQPASHEVPGPGSRQAPQPAPQPAPHEVPGPGSRQATIAHHHAARPAPPTASDAHDE